MADWTEEEDLLLTRAMKSCNGDLSSVRALLRTKRRRTAAEVKTRIKYLKLDGTSDFKVSLSTGSSSAKPKTSSTISSLHPNSLKANSTKATKAFKPNARKRSFSKVDTIDDDSSESSSSSRRAKLATRSRAVGGVEAQSRRQNEDEDVENTNAVDESQTKLDIQIEERKNLAIAKSSHSSRVSIDTGTDSTFLISSTTNPFYFTFTYSAIHISRKFRIHKLSAHSLL
ncbi:hypothetical protein BKA69DRAFT_1084756 [Paraphysoderma sedebokerense]|nr:hypothetical protein BKA69DRAFT_1084756 [Paraphysoderma sedebokerense]